MTDREEIIRALRLLFSEGDVFEVRILKAVSANYMRPHTESGYFDFEHITQAADAIAKIRAFAGAYVTLNPVDPDLLARAFNRLGPAEQNATTADDDIVRRRWLPIDCDAVRKSNISSTDEEHKAALELADQIRNGLASVGWPQPIVLDSGNGAQLLYRIDLPAKDDGLVQNVIASIAAASPDTVHVDLTVFNPARIWRLPGTMNCKGDSIPNRPHRMANIVSVPDEVRVVSRELLVAAASFESGEPQTQVVAPSSSGFVLDDWILRHGLNVNSPVPYNGGRKWVFKVCPFNPQHTNGSAVLIEEPSGAVGFRCHHNSCAGNDWRKLREMYEPGCYDKPKAAKPEPATVDISGLMKPKEEPDTSTDEESEVVLKLAPFPKELYNVPGFINDVMKFCLDTAPSPQPELAFACALALQGHLAGRKIECLDGIRTNTYIIMLAPSGSGKNHPRRIIRKILSRIGLGDEVFEDAASGQGIEDYLIAKPRLLWLSDEIYEMLQSVINDKSGNKEKIMKMLLTLFTSAADDYSVRAKAGTTATFIHCPHLTLFGACTPEGFFTSINERIIGHGLFARMELFPCESIPDPRIPSGLDKIPVEIEHHAMQWKNYTPPRAGNLNFDAKKILPSDAVMSLLQEYQLEAHRKKKKLQQSAAPDWQIALWSRAFESIVRLALIYACSEAESPEFTMLSEAGVKWARKLVHWDIKNKITMVKKYYYTSEFERNSEQIVNMMQHWHENKGWDTPMPGWKFNRMTKALPPKVRDAVIQSLQSQNRLEVTQPQTGGRPAAKYRLCH